jgi:hypothetical protein
MLIRAEITPQIIQTTITPQEAEQYESIEARLQDYRYTTTRAA